MSDGSFRGKIFLMSTLTFRLDFVLRSISRVCKWYSSRAAYMTHSMRYCYARVSLHTTKILRIRARQSACKLLKYKPQKLRLDGQNSSSLRAQSCLHSQPPLPVQNHGQQTTYYFIRILLKPWLKLDKLPGEMELEDS